MKKVLAIAMIAFMASCGSHDDHEATVQKEVNLAEMTTPSTLTVKIDGMTCAMGCAKAIEKSIIGIPGVVVSSVDFEGQEGTFGFDASVVKSEDLIAAIEKVNEGAYTVSKNEVTEGIDTGSDETEKPEGDVEALHTEKKTDEASV